MATLTLTSHTAEMVGSKNTQPQETGFPAHFKRLNIRNKIAEMTKDSRDQSPKKCFPSSKNVDA